ncbi:Alpha-N-acetylgalactosaminidase [Amphibalanus amphitrite]|uniref:Alpha-galactosidase n=1 Tax=Amphibalanus amphitrite TaxID=1232801 RepID=A0A6A4W9X3_AMPAM|nr:alpha-N-acetylgalactosaminidase-like [Amphibalanus amphitrite]KAF0303355.1 Alpha-N-acetylgalactosaminidase [Amphibalanus amphitrite]
MALLRWTAAATALLAAPHLVLGLDNGLALTPPLGWLAWERFRCITDCAAEPDSCVSEALFRAQADRMAADGYLAAGYQYIIIDDCWSSHERDAEGRLQADPDRFPSGIKALSDYVHGLGLKLGIYGDYGTYTCGGYPGSIDHMETDAQTFADWEVDYVKLDGCYSDPDSMDVGYPEFGGYLNDTGRPMVYSCSWPAYQSNPDYPAIARACNLWRNFDDIQDSWDSVASIIDFYGDHQEELIPVAGPGHWNDPDMLIVGDFGLSYEQSRAQMAVWSVLAAPLIMSVDLRTIRPEYAAILQNSAALAINQDRLGIQGRRVFQDQGMEIWRRAITPQVDEQFSYALAFLDRRTDGTPSRLTMTLRELGLDSPTGYRVQEVFDGQSYGTLLPEDSITVHVNPTGVTFLRCDLVA